MKQEEAISRFLSEINNQNTRRAYNFSLKILQAQCKERGINMITGSRQEIRDVVKDLIWEKGWSKATTKYRIAAMSAFYKWAVNAYDLRDNNPVDMLRPPEDVEAYKEIPSPTSELADRLIASVESARDRWAIRDRAIILLLRHAGLRSHELLALKVADVAENGILVVRSGKGNKGRRVALGKQAAAYVLKVYCPAYEIKSVLFPSTHKKRKSITRPTLWNMLKERCRQAGFTQEETLQCVSPHSWRHLWCTEQVGKGVHTALIMTMGGWSSTDMIARYMEESQLLEAISE